jgi:hypothetical protein
LSQPVNVIAPTANTHEKILVFIFIVISFRISI